MLINTSLSTETGGLRNNRAADSSPAPAGAPQQSPGANATPSDSARSAVARTGLQSRIPLEQDGVPGITDEAGADQVTGFLRANLLSQPGTALAAQGNPNPEYAYSLLQ